MGGKKEKSEGAFHLTIIKAVNIVSYLICRFIILVIIRPKVEIDKSVYQYNKKPGKGLILICNHKNISDPWILCASLPTRVFFKIMPIRIMGALDFSDPTASLLSKLGIVKIIYYLYGVMSFRKNWTFEEKLAPFINCVRSGGTILVFPEGRLYRERGVGQFKQGIIHIYNSAEAEILPFAINRTKDKIEVGVGAITTIPEELAESENPQDPFPSKQCEFLRQKVNELYENN